MAVERFWSRSKPTPKTPDFTDLLKRDLISYCKGLGLSDDEADKRAAELMDFVQREAQKFA